MNFLLSGEPIALDQTRIGPTSGALVSFQGVVRNTNEGKTVTALQ